VTAVVQQDDIAAADLPGGVALDPFGGCHLPVITSHGPHHGCEPHLARDVEHSRTAGAKWRTEEFGMRAYIVSQHLLAIA